MLPEGTLDGLTEDENENQLTEFLKLHVIPSRFVSADIGGDAVTNAAGEGIVFPTEGDKTTNGEATVFQGARRKLRHSCI